MPLTDRQKINAVIHEFNFERVHEVIKRMGWKLFLKHTQSKARIPSVIDLKRKARTLLKRALKQDEVQLPSIYVEGGFVAEKIGTHLRLQFIVEESTCYDWGALEEKQKMNLEKIE